MKITDATIGIQNLRLRTYIGFNPEELEKKQDVVINTSISYSAVNAYKTDKEENALDYKVITKAIIELVESGRFKLLEKLCADVLSCITENPLISTDLIIRNAFTGLGRGWATTEGIAGIVLMQ